MFNNVWFYILLYMAIGTMAMIVNAKVYKSTKAKIIEKSWGAALEFDSKALFHSSSRIVTYCLLAVAYMLWPVFLCISAVKRTKAYDKIMKEELEKEEWEKKFKEIELKWLAR